MGARFQGIGLREACDRIRGQGGAVPPALLEGAMAVEEFELMLDVPCEQWDCEMLAAVMCLCGEPHD